MVCKPMITQQQTNFMYIDAHAWVEKTAWRQTNINVQAGITYQLSLFVKQLIQTYPYTNAVPQISIYINGEYLCTYIVNHTHWRKICVQYNPTISGPVTIELRVKGSETGEWSNGYDMGIDDIKFAPLDNLIEIDITGPSGVCNNYPFVLGVSNIVNGQPPFTYSWSTGHTTPTVNLTQTLSSNYSVTVTDFFGCTGSSTFYVASLEPIFNISAPSSVCAMENVDFEINFTQCDLFIQSVKWNFGNGTVTVANLPTFNVSHIYMQDGVFNVSVEVLTSYGHVYHYSFYIEVLPLPDIEAYLTIFNNCNTNITNGIILNPNPNYTYLWQLDPGMGTITPSTGDNVTIQWTGIVNQVNSVYVTVTDQNGCTNTTELYYFNCCTCEPHSGCILLADESIPSVNYPLDEYIGQLFYINGVVEFSSDITFDNCEIKMGPMAKIIIGQGAEVEITGTTIEAGCGYMWDGLYVSYNSFFTMDDCSLKDAIHGVVKNLNHNGNFSITNSEFINNYTSLGIGQYDDYYFISFDLQYSVFENNTVTCTSFLYPPYDDKKSHIGINAANCFNLTINDNNFSFLDYGIYALTSDMSVVRNTFTTVSSFQMLPIGALASKPQAAIYAENTKKMAPSNQLLIGGNQADKNVFNKCHRGVNVYGNYNFICSFNDFDYTLPPNTMGFSNYGVVYYQLSNNNNVLIERNDFKNKGTAIFAYDNRWCHSYIYRNNIHWSQNNYPGTGINLIGDILKLSYYHVRQNTIERSRLGIRTLRLYRPLIEFNEITNTHIFNNTNGPNNNVPKAIHIQNTPRARVLNNIITNNGVQLNFRNIGIHLDASAGAQVVCNSISGFGSCFRATGQCVDSDILNNTFSNSRVGISLTHDGIVGQQGSWEKPSDNRWTPNLNVWQAGNRRPHFSWDSPGAQSPFWVRQGTTTFPAFDASNADPPTPGNWIVFYVANQQAPIMICSNINPILSNYGQLKQLMKDSIPFVINDEEARFWSKKEVLRIIRNDSVAMADPDFVWFSDTISSLPIGIFDEITMLIEQEEYVQAKALNYSVNVTADIVNFEKIANISRLNYYSDNSLNNADINELLAIATLCPYTEGEGVFIARALLAGVYPDTMFVSPCEEGLGYNNKSHEVTEEQQLEDNIMVKIFPNPSNDRIYLLFENESIDNLTINILNITGGIVLQLQCFNQCDKGIDIASLSDGMYFIAVYDTDYRLLLLDKFIKLNN